MLQTQSKEKTDYDTKILDIESKHIITADYNKFTKDIVGNSIKSKSLTDKSDISGFINSSELDKKIVATLATKADLKQNKTK